MKRICCIFNYAPDYRKSIYKKIDDTFDTQFYFGEQTFNNQESGIPKIDYSIFHKTPRSVKNKSIFGGLLWRSGIQTAPFGKYDAFIITGDASLSYLPFLLSCKIMRKKVYGWGHGFKRLNGLKGVLGRIYIYMLDGYFTYSEHGRDRMVELGINANKLPVIYNSIGSKISKIENYERDVYHNHFHNDYPTIIFVGRLTPSKRLDVLLNIQAAHHKSGLHYNTIIVGDGSEKDKLMELAFQNGISNNVWFFGACHDDKILAPLLYNADLCVSPGNVGLTAISALSYGTPIISHDSFEHQGPEYEAIVSNVTGSLYKYNNFDDLSNKIKLWLENSKDRDYIRNACIKIINSKWNSENQINIIKQYI